MLIPQYWAEAREKHRSRTRQITVRRFGWSEISQADAQAMADRRVHEALLRLISGEALPRREPKVAYGGADGVPIREEVVRRAGPDVFTRNSYGAICLNTPDVLFVDIDFPSGPPVRLTIVLCLLAISVPAVLALGHLSVPVLIGILSVLLPITAWLFAKLFNAWISLRGGPERVALRRIERFLESRPDWHLRLYRTPAGIRAVAMHRTFSADDPEVSECFELLGADRNYARMCVVQKCFRARVSPKPWRIGMTEHIRPRRGVWPVSPDILPQRTGWIDTYEARSAGYASCRFLESAGSMTTTARTQAVVRLHDEAARADSGLPIA